MNIARNGRDACTKAQRKQFDFVVTDEKMPVMSGREFCRQLRKSRRYVDTPIIFLTASPADLDADELNHELRVSAVFEKPFHPETIVHLIENELQTARNGPAGFRGKGAAGQANPETESADSARSTVQKIGDSVRN